jgi:hypothetical protein
MFPISANLRREFELKDIGIEEYIRWSDIHPCLASLGIPSLSQIWERVRERVRASPPNKPLHRLNPLPHLPHIRPQRHEGLNLQRFGQPLSQLSR